jgi:hypothetical protein
LDAAARVGGILPTHHPILMENLQIQNNLTDSVLQSGNEKSLFFQAVRVFIQD